jgi:hypothetical protein
MHAEDLLCAQQKTQLAQKIKHAWAQVKAQNGRKS